MRKNKCRIIFSFRSAMPRLSLLPRATLTTTNTNTNMKPTTLLEIRNAAKSMFSDPAVISVNIIASFGEVTVYRDGVVKIA